MKWLRRLFNRNPDRWPAWRPDQTLTPENRTIIRPARRDLQFEVTLNPDGGDWHHIGNMIDTGCPLFVRSANGREHG
ncbi:hypothetical protein PBI_SHEAKEIRA_38 [Mycobacterium phage SheaKeira]|nr:hypothetical protein PBI_SHEAKEIRA_38 [Mycobacterium phage SheaKeira]